MWRGAPLSHCRIGLAGGLRGSGVLQGARPLEGFRGACAGDAHRPTPLGAWLNWRGVWIRSKPPPTHGLRKGLLACTAPPEAGGMSTPPRHVAYLGVFQACPAVLARLCVSARALRPLRRLQLPASRAHRGAGWLARERLRACVPHDASRQLASIDPSRSRPFVQLVLGLRCLSPADI